MHNTDDHVWYSYPFFTRLQNLHQRHLQTLKFISYLSKSLDNFFERNMRAHHLRHITDVKKGMGIEKQRQEAAVQSCYFSFYFILVFHIFSPLRKDVRVLY